MLYFKSLICLLLVTLIRSVAIAKSESLLKFVCKNCLL